MSDECITVKLRNASGSDSIHFDQTEDDFGFRWAWSEIDGWWETPNARVELSESQPDGLAVTLGRHGGRALVLRGACHVPDTSDESYYFATQRLSHMSNLRRKSGLLLVDESPDKQAFVRTPDRTRVTRLGRNQAFRFEVPLLAPDPRKYSQTLHVDATNGLDSGDNLIDFDIANLGDEDTPFILEIDGPITDFARLRYLTSHEGLQAETATLGLTFDTLPGANSLILDFGKKTITRDTGLNQYDIIDPTRANWFYLKPGVNRLRYTRGGGAGSSVAKMTWRDAWA